VYLFSAYTASCGCPLRQFGGGMNTTIAAIDSRRVPSMVLAYTEAPRRLNLVPDVKPTILVLQPSGALTQANSREFQYELENALEQVTEAVIVDLIWVDSTDAYGIAALVAGLERAKALSKFLSFQSMNGSDRLALETAWAHQQETNAGAWTHTFSTDLESFLDDFTHG
jgi:anti-anti-sigma regulatory factor